MPVNPIPSNWAIHVISSNSSDTAPTLMFSHEQSSAKYIFNAGENTNRSFIQGKASWSGVRGIFLTGLGRGERDRVGGLTSLLMSFADSECKNVVDVVGPPGVKHLVASMRAYTYRETLPIISREAPGELFIPNVQTKPSPIFKDANMVVYAIPVHPSSLPSMEMVDASGSVLKRKREDEYMNIESGPPTKKRIQESSTDSDTTLSAPTASLIDILSSPAFTPANLNSTQAQEWYDLISDIMFPASMKARAERESFPEKEMERDRRDARDSRKKGKQKPQSKEDGEPKEPVFKNKFIPHLHSENGEGNIDEYRRPSLVRGFHSQLPKFTLPKSEIDVPSPSALSLCYLAIGPRSRGKFDGAKADALGIPRQMRNKLIEGETITFTPIKQFKKKKQKDTDQGKAEETDKGEEELRTVRPVEVIAPSQPPAAALILDIPSPDYIPSILAAFDTEGSTWARWTKYSKVEVIPEKLPEEEEFLLHTVFHILGEGVLEDERYQSFMSNFRSESEIHHVISSKAHSSDPITFTSSAYQLLKLTHLDSEIFRVPKFQLNPQKDITAIPNLPKYLTIMQPHSSVGMRPLAPPQRDEWAERIDKFHPAIQRILSLPTSTGDISKDISLSVAASQAQVGEYMKTTEGQAGNGDAKEAEEEGEKEGFILKPHTVAAFAAGRAAAVSYSSTPNGLRKVSAIQGKDVSIITLGTGSAIPGKYRNVSATVIQIPNYGNILLDCGEGTWGQLCRKLGTDVDDPNNVYAFLRDLKAIYISHVHADHHMGVAKVLAMRKALDPPPKHPLYLVTIRSVHLYLRELSDLEDLGLSDDPDKNGVVTILSPALHWKRTDTYFTSGIWAIGGEEDWLDMERSRSHAQRMCEALNLKSFDTADVRHRTRCYGCIIHSNDGWSVTFSGDTMPSDQLVYAANSGENATSVLIHEATMSDEQEKMAAKKAHSTIGQAIEIGRRMRASNVLLTHFSARQPKMPHQFSTVFSNTDDDFPFIVTAFDYAHFTIGSMWKMQFYMDAIDQSYRELVKEVGEENEAEEEERELLERGQVGYK
ncbi:hypothetical protein GYMLUDRAFT_197664 [Collybiopsis luxurians FD-317 M1]|uniref:ribonuclease Z n=1 Tax=Collybiopsis luxurians FD-317 M1 TaxID=944289 RepID=A0A0D0D1V3_9AGAR|nr:hypothetical protein GYMLUDRAFT_197664 [Collybiopsis luxurians FD-317 M1]